MSYLDGLLLCPTCRVPLPPELDWAPDSARCTACGNGVPRVRGVPRFVSSDSYVSSFSLEWTLHARTQLDDDVCKESEQELPTKTGLDPGQVKGKLVLDAGCGMGRYSDVMSRWGANVVGVDLSLAVESAHANLSDRPNVRVFQADLRTLPFRPGSFDAVFSLGVLHHTPDCRKAFESLIPFVKPGGLIAIWVYGHMGAFTKFSDVYRRLTTRLPQRLLYALCHVAAPLYYLYRLPIVGRPFVTVFPISMHPRASWRILDTFDWYSPQYQSKHTYPEVFRWFKEAGLQELDILDFPVAVRGRRPVEAVHASS
ncbi:MAG: class I SAM-dependent methyltransferase [Candidatus Riflebacteria bacterium]|nr:class I SAM-dependent methyltransferase [Candidatus Riflebacteria bacterium]